MASITLDHTMCDLYALDNSDVLQPTLVYYSLGMKGNVSTSRKFTYHSHWQTEDPSAEEAMDTAMQLKSFPQRYGLLAGKMRVVILDMDADGHEKSHDVAQRDRGDIYETYSRLRQDQQPIVHFAHNVNDINVKSESPFALMLPIDSLSHLPHLVDPDVHYEIYSKRGLAHSELSTPHSTVIDTLLLPHQASESQCVVQEVDRMVSMLDLQPTPFMVKLNQSLSSWGVLQVSSDEDRAKVKERLRSQLRGMLAQLNPANYHLHPCSLILQEFITGSLVAVSLFVTKKGRPIFIACCEQRFDDHGFWSGGCISFPDQATLQRTYAQTLVEVAQFLHRKGYYGPAGIDIITDEISKEQHVIDLNPRTTGTFHLGLLAGHFKERGLHTSTVIAERFPGSRADFEETFQSEVQDGSIVITCWMHDDERQSSYGEITIGGESSLEMKKRMAKVKGYARTL